MVELEPGRPDRVGALHRFTWKSRLPYELEFEMRVARVEAPYFLEAAADGELRGVGRWRLYEGPAGAVTYEWDVETTSRWMNLLAPLARPAFARNHDVVMRQGGEGLAGLVGGRLVAKG